MTWQDDLAPEVAALLGVPTFVHGSVAGGELDEASDLDVVAVVDDLRPWRQVTALDELGERWAWQSSVDDQAVVHRVVFADGRWLDLKLVTGSGSLPPTRRIVQPAKGHRDWSRAQPSLPPEVVRARFLASLALVRAGRDDQLIAGHLALDLARAVLEVAMLERDELAGTTIHHHGGPLNEVWTQVREFLAAPRVDGPGAVGPGAGGRATGGPATDGRDSAFNQLRRLIVDLSGAHEQAAHRLWGHRPDDRGLRALATRLWPDTPV